MIVKIAQDKSWVIYDNFVRIHYEQTTVKEAEKSDPDAIWFDTAKRSGRCLMITACRKAVGQDKKGHQIRILADSVVYLCNDDGKTIERLN